MKKVYKVKPISPEKAIANVERYYKNREEKKESKALSLERKAESLQKYLTKKGTPKKSALRSQKAIREYNKLVRSLAKNTYNRREQIRKKSTATAVKKGTYKVRYGKKIRKNFALDIYHKLLGDGLLGSDQLINLTQDYKLDEDLMEDMLEKLRERTIFESNDSMKRYIQEDDFYKVAEKVSALIKDGKSVDEAIDIVQELYYR